MVRGTIFIASMALLVAGCASIDAVVTPMGPPLPPRPIDCAISFFSSGPPPSPHKDLAAVHVVCRNAVEVLCRDRLRQEACAAGADAVYAIVTTTTGPGHYYEIAATIAKASH
jgi:hypothetical protein